MKRVFKKILIILGLAMAILIITCPNEKDYNAWLEKEYGIQCVEGICTHGEEEISWQSRALRSAGIYTRVIENYRDSAGERMQIRAIGILGRYYKF